MKNTWLKILIPVQALLMLNQLITGLNAGPIQAASPMAFTILHVGGGILLVALIFVHVILNWSWIRNSYFKRRS